MTLIEIHSLTNQFSGTKEAEKDTYSYGNMGQNYLKAIVKTLTPLYPVFFEGEAMGFFNLND